MELTTFHLIGFNSKQSPIPVPKMAFIEESPSLSFLFVLPYNSSNIKIPKVCCFRLEVKSHNQNFVIASFLDLHVCTAVVCGC